MRFRVSDTPPEDAAKPSLPTRMRTLRRKRQADDVKAGLVEQNVKEDAPHDSANVSRRESRRKTVMDFFKGKSRGSNETENSFQLPTRSMTQKAGVTKPNRSNRNSAGLSEPSKEDSLERLMGKPKGEPKLASDNFFLKQNIKASSRQASSIRPSPFSQRSQAELDRKPLSEDEITRMFVGAPHFNVERKKSSLRPQVVFRGGDIDDLMNYGRDYQELGHESFDACTLGVHRTRNLGGRPSSVQQDAGYMLGRAEATFLEVPNMLSASGLDRGAVGFEHFLQLAVADSTVPESELDLSEKRRLLASNPEGLGLRMLSVEELIDRLSNLSELHSSLESRTTAPSLLNEQKLSEMGEDLFGKVLDPELGTTSAGTGNVSLNTQIAALQKVLSIENLWHDFGIVEWRIRLGQLLWATPELEGSESEWEDEPRERDVLLLQIALGAELLIRLQLMEALPASGNTFPPLMTDLDQDAIRHGRSTKLSWDLLLAEKFLDNVRVAAKMPSANNAGNRSSILSALSYITAKEEPTNSEVKPLLFPRRADQQVAGLLTFAEALSWPHIADVKTALEAQPTQVRKERPISMVSVYATPLSSPTLEGSPGARSSYFGGWGKQTQQNRPGLSRKNTAQSMQLLPASNFRPNPDGFEVGGWLSRSWLSGLVLPGEAASHFLISTVLENSPLAIDALGDCANLYGGFVYRDRTYWSKSCVVGRVLGATSGASESMGWISVPGAPSHQPDGWLNIDVKDFPYPASKPRIEESEIVAKASSPLHGASTSSVQAGDFTTPTDGPPVMGNEARSHGLRFSASSHMPSLPELASGIEDTDAVAAFLTFGSPFNSKLAPVRVPLTYEVYFISSYPCHPQVKPNNRTGTAPTTPTSPASYPADSTRPSESTLSFDKELPAPPAHPLHIDYHFQVVPAATLLTAAPPEARSRTLSTPNERPATAEGYVEEEVVILDCRGCADLELLARAWCAKVGENALIGKEGRTCVSCCIREARALGVGVVIRI